MLSNLQKMRDGIKHPRKRKNKRGTTIKQGRELPKKPTTNRKGMIVTDRAGTPIVVFDGASHALSELNKWKKTDDDENDASSTSLCQIQTAVASCTDKPSFARQCMEWLIVDDGSTLFSCFDHIEIRPGDKRKHFESLQRITNIPYEQMLFFDDYDLNIESVGSLGVKCIHTPNGMTRDAWDEGMELFGLN
jgi:magnesium-dependent phosphatase 1